MSSRGVIYYATGEEYVEEATRSARSLKEHNDIEATVFTDIDTLNCSCFDRIEHIDSGEYTFYDRINYFKQTPYGRILYPDANTHVAGDTTPVSDLLERFEVVAAVNESWDTTAEHTKFETVDIDVPDSCLEYQCGVIGYRATDTVQEFFNDWQSRYEPCRGKHILDQSHFRETLDNSELSIGTLPTEYNVLVNFAGYLHSPVTLLHYAGTNRPFLGEGPRC